MEKATHLTQIHHNRLVDFLPQMGAENLNERDLQGGDLAVHEDACQVKLDLVDDDTKILFVINICSVRLWI